MASDAIQVHYNQNLEPLEKLLSTVSRPGNFFVHGSREMPMPKIEIEGMGILSFPLPKTQIQQLIQGAALAPFGRGEETIVDTAVRKVWQLPLEKVKISGATWEKHFKEILSEVEVGLGCHDITVIAQLYKMLVYDEGCFFLPHRDTEKTEGMFGTLVIVLPSAHQGGELIIRHAGHEARVNMSNTEVSSLSFAAFYADCEHEILPIKEGSRVCLIYNLIQHSQKGQSLLSAPLYDAEIKQAAEIIEKALTKEVTPIKIAWLLEHQYTPAALSFQALKNRDAALAQVLTQAALRAGCVIHLAIVHLEESGSAEIEYDYSSRRSKWRYYDEEDVENEEFEVVDVCDTKQFVDGWINTQNQTVDFGELPLEEGELLPQGALDGEAPDEQRLMEATGNEGASFERSYHRAALVIWRQDRYAEVLLQAGVSAVMPYFKECMIASCANTELHKSTVSLADLILNHWEADINSQSYGLRATLPDHSDMLNLLMQLKEPLLISRFIGHIVTKEYDGSENDALVAAALFLKPEVAAQLFSQLISANINSYASSCIDLLSLLIEKIDSFEAQTVIAAAVASLKNMGKTPLTTNFFERIRRGRSTPIDSTFIVKLWNILIQLKTDHLSHSAADAIIDSPSTFNPETVVAPALCQLYQRYGTALHTDAGFVRLLEATSEFLLKRSDHPPTPPRDWRQEISVKCQCQDCQELQSFVLNPESQVHSFRVKKERRQHLHHTIDSCDMEMTHITEREGSPQTLVCTKTRRNYEAKCKQYQADIVAMRSLIPIFDKLQGAVELYQRLTQATARAEHLK